eukprot:TRINITY_DN11019_c0_g1_i1.p2 TRINITY_DN11019_c0_g1~~TRINITY_DN11019_c0_g1_i1.p2  ORF type:complete len:102 (+),score=6.73 TRINITY_DN11019_c0_g1_i1:13-318(+)
MSRCAFCNNALLGINEVEEMGKRYHKKCAPSSRGGEGIVTITPGPTAAELDAKAKFSSQPKVIGEVVMEEGGFTVDPRTGKKTYTGRFKNPKVGKPPAKTT